MHLLLTDGLTCTRCGPEFGLILLATRMDERRVLDGTLGCSNCRDRYPVVNGLGDLRPEPRGPIETVSELELPSDEELLRMAALIGVAGGTGRVALLGPTARFAPGLAARISDVDWVTVSAAAATWSEQDGVDRILAAGVLPFRDRTLRGVVLEGGDTTTELPEAIRVLAPGHRLVLLDPPGAARDMLLARGLKVHEPADGVLVAGR